MTAARRGELVELADTPDSKSGAYSVRVQVPYSLPLYFNKEKKEIFLCVTMFTEARERL